MGFRRFGSRNIKVTALIRSRNAVLIVLGYLIPRLWLSTVQVFRIDCSWASLSVHKWSSGCKFCHSADVDRVTKPQTLSPAFLWAGHSTSYVLSVHQPCPEHQDVGSCDPPAALLGRSLQHPAVCRSTEGCACPVCVSKLCLWPAACGLQMSWGCFSKKCCVEGLAVVAAGCAELPGALQWVLPLRPALEAGPAYLQQRHPKNSRQKTTFSTKSFFPGSAQEKTCRPSFLGKQGMPKPQPQPPSWSPLSPLPSRFGGAAALWGALSSWQPCAAGSWAQLMPPQEGNALDSARYQ